MIDKLETIKEFGYMIINIDNNHTIAYLEIIGEIEGHNIGGNGLKATSYEHIIPILSMLELDPDIDGILLVIHTTGGDVDAGLAIAECISSLNKKVVSLTLGTCHSIGIPIAVAADYTIISPSSLMLAHPVRYVGTMIGAPNCYEFINKLQRRITDFVVAHSNISRVDYENLIYNQNELSQDIGTMTEAK